MLLPVVRSKKPEGWEYGEPDGEGSYLNCLLTALAKLPPTAIELVTAQPLPDLSDLAIRRSANGLPTCPSTTKP